MEPLALAGTASLGREPCSSALSAWVRAVSRGMASLDNPFAWPGNVSAKTLAEGAGLMEQARKTGLGRSSLRCRP